MKKRLSLFLVVCLLLALAPMSAMAARVCDGVSCADNFHAQYVWVQFPHDRPVVFEEGVLIVDTQEELVQTGFTPALTELYSNGFFETHYLVIVSLIEPYMTNRHGIERIDVNGDIIIRRIEPDFGLPTEQAWHIAVELCRGFRPDTFEVVFAEGQPEGFPFWDVREVLWGWARPYILNAYEREVIHGSSNWSFLPGGTLTRAEAVMILWNAVDRPAAEHPVPFYDVAEGIWFADAVAWAAEAGVVSGRPGHLFAPWDSITRQELFAILRNFADVWLGEDVTATPGAGWPFPDHDLIHAWAVDHVMWLHAMELVNGNAQGEINPLGISTRAEVAVLVMRFMNKFDL